MVDGGHTNVLYMLAVAYTIQTKKENKYHPKQRKRERREENFKNINDKLEKKT